MGMTIVYADDNLLINDLKINNATISPKFDQYNNYYSVTIDENTDKLDFEYEFELRIFIESIFKEFHYEPPALINLTDVRTNDFEEANNYYKKAARLNSYKDISSLNLGQINMILRDYDEAEKFFYEGIKSNDDKISANSYYYLAKIKILEHRYDLAIQYINMAIEIDYEIKNKIESDEQFLPILGKITIEKVPRNFKSKITKFDEETIEHLNKTYNVVETLSDYEPRENYKENEKER